MRIVQVSHAYPPTFGGVESHVHDLASRLTARGHEVTCFVGGPSADSQEPSGPRVIRHPALTVQHLIGVESEGPEAIARAYDQISVIIGCLVRDVSPDVIHVHNGHHFSSALARALLDNATQPCVNTVHDRVGSFLRPEVLDLPWAHVLYVSEYLRQELPTAREHSVAWLGIDLGRFTPSGPKDPRLGGYSRPVVLHPARLLRWKGLHISIEALARLVDEGLDASLVLCGSELIVDDQGEFRAYRAELEALARDLQVTDRVHFEVFERNRIDEAYRAADLIWYPTVEAEPLGLVPLEAMATGRALVTSDTGGMRETVDHARTGLRVPPGDAAALASASLQLLRDPTMRQRLVTAALEHSRRFDLEGYVDELDRLYHGLLR